MERASTQGSAVFVDDTGRKSRRARRAANGVGALALGYVLLTLVTLARPPWVPQLTLPGLGGPLPTPTQQPPRLGPEAAITPIPTADDQTPDGPPASDAEATPTAPEDATTVPFTPPSTQPSPPSSGPSTTTSTSTTQPSRPGGGPPSSIPGNGNGPPTSKPGHN